MRILAVTNMYPTPQAPAAGTFVEQQISGLRRIGLEVEVLFVDRLKQGICAYLSVPQHARVRVGHFQPDIVHIMYGGVMADQVTGAIGDRPTIVTFHGSDLLGEHLSGYLRKLLAGYGVWASWRAARRANGIVVVSKALQDALPADVDRSKVRIIPCGIDLERFRPLNQHACRKWLGWDPERFHVLFPSSIGNPVKRPGLAKEALEILNRFGIPAEMHYLRGVPNKEVPLWLNASNVLLLTSLHEGSPTIIKEALACNLPIVSVDVGDVRDRIQGVEGCYLSMPHPNDLAAKLLLVYSGRQKVDGRVKMQELSLERVAFSLEKFYREVLLSFRSAVSAVEY